MKTVDPRISFRGNTVEKNGPLQRIDWRQVWWFGGLPALLSGSMLAMYFSGSRVLENIVSAPYFEAVALNSRREFGLLEGIQHAMLLAVVCIAARAVFVHPRRAVRRLMTAVAIGAALLLVEEIDYGLHYYEYLMQIPHDQLAEKRNLHNIGSRTAALKSIATACAVVVFGLAPFVLWKAKRPWVRYFRPPAYAVLTLIVAGLTRTIAHRFDKAGLGFGLDGNLSEFRELVMYYLGLAYTVLLVRRVPGQGLADEAEQSDDLRCAHEQGA